VHSQLRLSTAARRARASAETTATQEIITRDVIAEMLTRIGCESAPMVLVEDDVADPAE